MAPKKNIDKQRELARQSKERKEVRKLARAHALGMRDAEWPKAGSLWKEEETGKKLKVRALSFHESTFEWLITFAYLDDDPDDCLHTRTMHYWCGSFMKPGGRSRSRFSPEEQACPA